MKFDRETILIVVITLAAVLVFLNALPGEFVYDDNRQIATNPLIQETDLVGKALTSDVWAFKGDGTMAASNYWRPTFTAWCILNFKLFGQRPTGWHLSNIVLHAGVCLLAFFLLRRWNVAAFIAATVAIVFAVHPVHVESVTWISGSPDLLFGLFFLLSLLFADRWTETKSKRELILSLVFYLFALGSKEVAVLCLPVYVILFGKRDDTAGWSGTLFGNSAWRASLGFIVAAIIYFLVRLQILGAVSRPVENAPSIATAILTAPSAFLFYVRQICFPFWLGPNYSLRPVESPGLLNFVLPLVGMIAVLAGLIYVSNRSLVRRIGLALFVFPMLPALLIFAFPSDQIVHDRYLYVPLLGFLIVAVDLIAEHVAKRLPEHGEKYVLVAGVLIAAPLAFKTFQYNSAWLSDVALWRHAVTIDDTSASNWLQLGAALMDRNEIEAAGSAYKRSLELRTDPLALVGAGRVAIAKNDYDSALADLDSVVQMPPGKLNAYTLFQAYEAIAIANQEKKDLAAAERALREARDRLPIYRAALTEKIAVVLYLQNRKNDALTELEGVRNQARTEMLPASKAVFFRLGLLYAEAGRNADARVALEEYIRGTARIRDMESMGERRTAIETLRALK